MDLNPTEIKFKFPSKQVFSSDYSIAPKVSNVDFQGNRQYVLISFFIPKNFYFKETYLFLIDLNTKKNVKSFN